MKKRIGIIGLGNIAQKVYLPLLCQHDAVEVVGVMSKTAVTVKQASEKYRVFGTTEISELLRKELDAIFVHTPTETHYSVVKECLSAKIPVYVDKPLSYDWAEAKEMAALAEKHGVLLGVGFNRRFAPFYVKAKAWVEEQGGFEWCSVIKHRTSKQKYKAKLTLYDDLIHILDMLLWLGGNNYNLTAHSERTDSEGKLLSAAGSIAFQAADASYSMVRQAGVDVEKLELHGHGRSVEVVNMEAMTLFRKDALPQSSTFGSWDTILYRRGFVGVVDHFLQTLQAPEQCLIRADLMLKSHALVESL